MSTPAPAAPAATDPYQEARDLLRYLDPETTKFTFFTADDVLLPDGKRRDYVHLRKQMHGSFDHWLPRLSELNNQGAGVFVSVNRTDLQGRKRHNMLAVRALFNDDDIPGVSRIFPLHPCLLVETSPGKSQPWWFASEGLSFEDYEGCMRTMIAKHGSDLNAKDVNRVLRLPGFTHNKRTPHKVRIIGGTFTIAGFGTVPYTPAELLRAFPPTPKPTPAPGTQRLPGEGWDLECVRSALACVPITAPEKAGEHPDHANYMHWLNVGMALHHGSDGADEGLELWDTWSKQQEDKYQEWVCQDKWGTFRSDGANSIRLGTLFHLATENDWIRPPRAVPFPEVQPYDGESATDPFTGEQPTIDTVKKRLVLNPKKPLQSARALVATQYTRDGVKVLQRVGGDFHEWCGTHYRPVDDDAMRSRMWTFLGDALKALPDKVAKDEKQTFTNVPFDPTQDSVSNVLDALRGVTHAAIEAPAWLNGAPQAWAASDVLACSNGFVHLPTRTRAPSSPNLFITASLPFAYDPAAPAPASWLKFLTTLWPNDQEAIDCLQEFVGLFTTADMRHHKALFLLGPRRSGKGTIARIVTALLGQENVVSPTMGSLGRDFGMESLIGKRLALLSDARLSERMDSATIAERLLTLTGDDSLTIPRKYKTDWTGRLATRVMMLSNNLPKFGDASGALPSRFIILPMQHSFLGREDLDLEARLLKELPGILNWALVGLDRLKARGRFVPPRSGADAMQSLEDLASPVGAFVRDECRLGPNEQHVKTELYGAWCLWCQRRGQPPRTDAWFGTELRAAFPSIGEKRGSANGQRSNLYTGITLARTLQF